MSAEKPRRLGRGLEALFGATAAPAGGEAPSVNAGPLREIPVGDIRPNPFQPRKEFDPQEIKELKESIAANGLLQPVTVRPSPTGPGYELIAGERRFRAVQALGWAEITALVKPIDDRAALTLALVENLQRADLNPIEEAEGYQRLATEFHLTQNEIAEVVGKDRSTIANMLRILVLPESVRLLLRDGAISTGHARALLALPGERSRIDLAHIIAVRKLSVRDVEQRVQLATGVAAGGGSGAGAQRKRRRGATTGEASTPDPLARRIEDRLRTYLQTDVRVDLSGPQDGTIAIRFYSNDDLDRLLERMLGPDSSEARL